MPFGTDPCDWGGAVAVGVGSGGFHAFATRQTQVLDLLPIFAFQVVFLWVYLRQVACTSATVARVLIGAFLVACAVMFCLPRYLNGSLIYLPALATLGWLAIDYHRRSQTGRWQLAVAAGLFMIALVFRTIDRWVCAEFPLGSHFLWHLLTALVLLVAMRVLIGNHARVHRGG